MKRKRSFSVPRLCHVSKGEKRVRGIVPRYKEEDEGEASGVGSS